MTDQKIFVDGLRFERPNEKAPKWIRGKISAKVDKLVAFLQQHQNEKGWVNIDLKEAKTGTMYFELNTYRKGQSVAKEPVAEPQEENPLDQIPF